MMRWQARVQATSPTIRLLDDLGERGVGTAHGRGCTSTHTAFLSQGLAHELQLVLAPLIVGQADAASFLSPACYPGGSTRRMNLVDVTASSRRPGGRRAHRAG